MRVLLLLALLCVAAPRAGAQPAADFTGGAPSLHHDFPLVGQELRLVLSGFEPGGTVLLRLGAPPEGTAPSFMELLADAARFRPVPPDSLAAFADEAGVLELVVPLRAGVDDGRRIEFVAEDPLGGGRRLVSLLVHPPTALLAVEGGLARVDLLDGRPLGELVEGSSMLVGAGLERDGLRAWLLRDRGRLELLSALRWGAGPLTVRQLPSAGDALAHSPRAGAAFVLSDLGEGLLGRLHFVGGDWNSVGLEALESAPGHRRWAISADGERAFVAEDELLVREVDLRRDALGALFTAGVAGDTSITDMLVQGDRLLVLTRRAGGLAGSLTRFDLSTGRVSTDLLDVDPLRFVAVGPDTALVLPAEGRALVVVEGGLPGVPRLLPGEGELLDAAHVGGEALLLLGDRDDAGAPAASGAPQELLLFEPGSYRVTPLALPAGWGRWPATERLLGAGGDVALLLGAARGPVFRLRPSTGALEALPGLRRAPSAPFALLP